MTDDYPSWICTDCGKKHGKRPDNGNLATFHEGTCEICGKHALVTEPRDFGHLKTSWKIDRFMEPSIMSPEEAAAMKRVLDMQPITFKGHVLTVNPTFPS